MNKLPATVALTILFLVACQGDTKTDSPKAPPAANKRQESTQAVFVPGPAKYAGGKVCASCHEAEFKKWTGSHHDLAMQKINDETGQSIAAAIDNQKGSRMSIGAGLTWYGHAEEVMENWAKDMKKWVVPNSTNHNPLVPVKLGRGKISLDFVNIRNT